MIRCRIRQIFSWLLLVGAIALGVLWGLGLLNAPSAAAAIRQLEEAPGQIVYQSRQTLKDQHGNSWQAIAFQRIHPHGETQFELRLVGFPGLVEIDRAHPLRLTDSLGNTLTAIDDADSIFTPSGRPEPNVGQYNLQAVLPHLQVGVPLKVTVPTINGDAAKLIISPSFISEWHTVSHQKSSI